MSTLRRGSVVGGLALGVFAVAGIAWFLLELVAPNSGFDDTDSPEAGIAFIRAQPAVYRWGGIALLAMAASLSLGVLALADVMGSRPEGQGRPSQVRAALAIRFTTILGLVAAASFLFQGVLRSSVEPLLYVAGLDRDWGESGYLVFQMAGVHGFVQAAVLCASAWAIMVGALGWRTRTLPRVLCLAAVVPAMRLLILVGPTGLADLLPEETWFLLMASVPALPLWCALVGVVLGWRALLGARTDPSVSPSPAGAG